MRPNLNTILTMLAAVKLMRDGKDTSEAPLIIQELAQDSNIASGDMASVFEGATKEHCFGRDPIELKTELERDFSVARGKMLAAFIKRCRKAEARLGHSTK
jgi:hypothetical protein